jgi:O-antigen/teichoic acid export membrane protein
MAARAAPVPAGAVAWEAVRSLWFHTALNDVVQVLFRWVDKLALNFLLPAALFALYFNGTLDIPFLPLLLGAAGSTLLLHFGEPARTEASRLALLRAAGELLGRLVFPLFFFLLFFRRELFGVAFAHRYDAAVPLFVVALLVVPLRAYNFTALLLHKGQGRLITTGALLDLALALALMYPLYRLLGLAGVALAFVLSTYVQAGYYLRHTTRLLGVPWSRLLPLRPWAGQLLGAALGLGLLHALLVPWLPERNALLVGASLLGLWLAAQLVLARRPV